MSKSKSQEHSISCSKEKTRYGIGVRLVGSEKCIRDRADMKRRSKLHEKVEKESEGSDDAHLWG